MAEVKKSEKGPGTFRVRDVREIGAAPDGSFAYLELIEFSHHPMALAYAPHTAPALANRILSAAQLAEVQRQNLASGGDQPTPFAPMVTEHTVVPAEDGDTIALTLVAGSVPFMLRLSASRSEKLRASLKSCEAQIAAADNSA